MKLIFGLGNPGLEYENTRHNAGFLLIDRLGTAFGAEFRLSKPLSCQYARVRQGASDILLVKPLTYMNLSGEAFIRVLHCYKAESTDAIVAHDDVSLPLGRLRFQKAGGAGGQHGVESIIKCLGSKSFDRLKIGVGPDPGGARRASYVLGRFSQDDKVVLDKVLEQCQDGVEAWLRQGLDFAANRFNSVDFSVTAASDKPSAPPEN